MLLWEGSPWIIIIMDINQAPYLLRRFNGQVLPQKFLVYFKLASMIWSSESIEQEFKFLIPHKKKTQPKRQNLIYWVY